MRRSGLLGRHSVVLGPLFMVSRADAFAARFRFRRWLDFDSTSKEFGPLSATAARGSNVGHTDFLRRPTDIGRSRRLTQPTAKITEPPSRQGRNAVHTQEIVRPGKKHWRLSEATRPAYGLSY